MANHLKAAMAALGPTVAATLAWPILYLGSPGSRAGILLTIPALLFCIGWAWLQTGWITNHLTELTGERHKRLWKTLAFACQTLGVLASAPIFFGTLYMLKTLNVEVNLS